MPREAHAPERLITLAILTFGAVLRERLRLASEPRRAAKITVAHGDDRFVCVNGIPQTKTPRR